MSITGALQAGISGLQAQSLAMAVISDNIANMNTVGYKRTSSQFASIVANADALVGFGGGGVRAVGQPLIDQQGLLQATGSGTDLSVSGSGMFVVRPSADSGATAEAFFTRAGSFSVNKDGYLVNAGGYFLQGELLTQTQRDAVIAGNARQLTATSLGTLQPVEVDLLSGSALPTTKIEMKANLPANDAVGEIHTMSITLFDQLGGLYTLDIEFEKTAAGTWDLTTPAGGLHDANGNSLANAVTLAPTSIAFNSDGSLNAPTPFTLDIAGATPNGSAFSAGIEMDFGTDGDVDGVTQFDAPFNVGQVTQNGLAFGAFSTAEVTKEGIVNALFSNGQRVPIFVVPLAEFTNLNGLQAHSDNVFSNTADAGFVGLGQPRFGSAGTIASGTLEQSTVDLSQEFTNMIVAQRSYSANGKIISTADEMLDELVRLKR